MSVASIELPAAQLAIVAVFEEDDAQSQSLEQQPMLHSSTRGMPARSRMSRQQHTCDGRGGTAEVMCRAWGRGYWQSSVILRMSGRIGDTWCGEKALYSYFYSSIADPPWPAHARRNAVQQAVKDA